MGDLQRPGDYALGSVVEDDVVKPMLWFLLPIHEGAGMFDHPTPGSGLHGITEPPWTFRECADGSIEARASIACGRSTPDGEYWHGFLDGGDRTSGNIWRDSDVPEGQLT